MKTDCLVVTYNRLDLLRENVGALMRQTHLPRQIFIVDNHSTDGTSEWLDQNLKDKPRFVVVHLPENTGGAGGFCEGMKRAVEGGADWIWVMDDDTIPAPTALEELERAILVVPEVAFACSKVVWTDGSLHQMNLPAVERDAEGHPRLFTAGGCEVARCSHCSFVSSMFRASAIRQVGLPIREFFIWMDDVEFTCRLSDQGFTGLYVPASSVLHKTPGNMPPSLSQAPVGSEWKYYYFARNHVYFTRQRKKSRLAFWFSVLNRWRLYLHWVSRRTDGPEGRRVFRRAVCRGLRDGLRFKPSVEFPR